MTYFLRLFALKNNTLKLHKIKLKKILAKIEAEIMLGSFNYTRYFPNSKNVKFFAAQKEAVVQNFGTNSQLLIVYIETGKNRHSQFAIIFLCFAKAGC